jgi:hypothetical protein
MRVMTLNEHDWIDDVLDDQCEMWQIGLIEGLLQTSAANYLYSNINFNDLTFYEAEEIIKELYENNCPTDPKEQFKQMCKRGVFK